MSAITIIVLRFVTVSFESVTNDWNDCRSEVNGRRFQMSETDRLNKKSYLAHSNVSLVKS